MVMSKQQLDRILQTAAQNPPPADVDPQMMRASAEGIMRHTPIAENVTIERMTCGPFEADLL
jgi:hypothetical protein